MSLLVNVFTRGPDGKMQLIEPEEHWQELAGFESYRQKLYGSRAARSLGLSILPRLDGSDVYVEGADVLNLQAEAELALANIKLFVPETETSADNLRPRFENIIAATRHAIALGGGVVIW